MINNLKIFIFKIFIDNLFLASIGLNEEQCQIQELATNFAKNEMAPNMEKWDMEVCIHDTLPVY